MSRMVEVVIDSVRVSLTNQQRIVVLRELGMERYLPIWIGPYEAEAITIALQEIEVARPQTHDLLKNAIHMLSGRLLRVEVVSLREDVFYGNLVVEVNGSQIVNVDCRPSDALALAVRAHVPVMVAREVMESAGVIPEQDVETSEADAEGPSSRRENATPMDSEDGEDRLSIFEDFLQNLDIDNPPDSSDEDDEPDEGKPRQT